MNQSVTGVKKVVLGFVTVSFILLGVISAGSHYLAPRPSLEDIATKFTPPGPEWFLEQLPLYDTVPLTTFLHVIPAGLFMLFLGLQLSAGIRRRLPALHRVSGRFLVAIAVVFNVSGIVLSVTIPFAGPVEILSTLMINAMFFYFLFRGITAVKNGKINEHRRFMLRMVALSFAPLTLRLLMTMVSAIPGAHMPSLFVLLTVVSVVINLFVLERYILKSIKPAVKQLPAYKSGTVKT